MNSPVSVRTLAVPCLYALAACMLVVTAAASAAQEGDAAIPTTVPTTVSAPIAQALPGESGRYLRDKMTPWARELADMIDVTPLLQRLQKEQQRAKALGPSAASVERMLTIERLLYLRSKIDVFVQTCDLEVDSVIGKLNSGLAELADRKALIADTRARTLRRQSFINFISGGLTKIGGYSIALTPATLIPTNVLEIFDGGVQTGLSVFTLKQLKEEQQLGKARPEILRTFLNGSNLTSHMFPESVWSFLNRVPPESKEGKTRRQELIDSWVKIGRLSDGRSPKQAKRQNTPFQASGEFRLDALDDTVAMTSDLKSVIEGMDTSLMELGQAYRDSYKDDPDI